MVINMNALMNILTIGLVLIVLTDIILLTYLVLLPLRMYHGWVMTSAIEKNSNQSHTVEKEPQESLTNKEFTLAMEDLYHENNRGQMRDT